MRFALVRSLLVLCALCGAISSSLMAQTPAYLNTNLSFEDRARDLVSRMTLEEKATQMIDNAVAVQRLGVPEYGWWNEGLHGVARAGLATSFPQAIGMAATWNDQLMFDFATVTSIEARAKHHDYARRGERRRYQGLTYWSPNINIFRDPRWGRGQETYGEDPFLTGQLGVQFIRGLQGDDPKYFRTVATVKHFAVHSGPEPERHVFDAIASERDFRETYLPHFERGIREGGAYSLMCAYNRVYGAAACGSELLNSTILRGEWGFRGFIVSDCGAIDDMYLRHKVVQTASQAAALGVKSGTDLDCGRVYPNLVQAVRNGEITEAQIDTSLYRLMLARMKLGMFDPDSIVPWAKIAIDTLDSPTHRALALRAARESIVLLKNASNTLPLRRDLGTIAVIGPSMDERQMLLGNYNGTPADPITPLRGIREAVGPNTRVLSATGSDLAEGYPVYGLVSSGILFSASGAPGLDATYYSSRTLADSTVVVTRVDNEVGGQWGEGAPLPQLNPNDFGVRYSGVVRVPRTGTYRFGLLGTVKYRLWFNDSLMVQSRYFNGNDEYPDPRQLQTPAMTLEAGKDYTIRIEGTESYGQADLRLVWSQPQEMLGQEALSVARQADAIVLVLGLTARLEGEEMPVQIPGFRGGDRTNIDLPAPQQRLMEQVVALGKPTVLVLMSGSAIAVNWAQDNVPAIIHAWYPGQAGGTAIADVLFGNYNPAGRLPVTFYRGVEDQPAFDDYTMEGRTYRFYKGTPLYPFGHGLSYTTFRYSKLQAPRRVRGRDSITVTFDVTNTGAVAGDEVPQLYVRHLGRAVTRPIKDLRGYTRIHLRPGETKSVTLRVPVSSLAYWDETNDRWVVENEDVELQVGPSSAVTSLTGKVRVRR